MTRQTLEINLSLQDLAQEAFYLYVDSMKFSPSSSQVYPSSLSPMDL